ncbi:hypothetical protein ERO13_A13G047050v2 [Gossypium hirsutum]|nr:hypothetical protein ERO13_A13G047050v2 [Gossypium hirsutum]
MDLLLTQSKEEGYAELDFLATIIPDLDRSQDEIYGPQVLERLPCILSCFSIVSSFHVYEMAFSLGGCGKSNVC